MANESLRSALVKQKESSKPLEISGTLGITINGEKTVEVPNRNSFVYVQLRDSQSELIQAFNDKVSPVYGLPVIVVRQGNRYVIDRRDTERYTDWQSYSPFLPRHGDQHSFNSTQGGGDIVWVYGRQFMPMLVIPSGSLGGPNVIVSEYVIQDQSGNWKYSGNTGTQNILQYRPTNNQGVMILVYVDQNTGNPGIIVNSGSYFAGTLTGTSDIVPYLPQVTNSNYLVAMAVRLASGTMSIGWDNLYDVRQYYNGLIPTGTSGGLSSIPIQDEGIPQGNATTFNFVGAGVTATISGSVANINIPGGGTSSGVYKNPGSVLFAGSDGFPDEDNLRLHWDNDAKIFRIGPPPSPSLNNSKLQLVGISGTATPSMALVAYGTGTSGAPHPTWIGYRQRGTLDVPEPVQNDDGLGLFVGAGYDGAGYINSARIRFSTQGTWITGTYAGSKVEIQVTPSGTNTRQTRLEIVGNGANIPDGTYMISGSPHTHDSYQISGAFIANVNYLINGGWDFAQRQVPNTLTSITNKNYGPDRWMSTFSTGTLQFQRNNGIGETGITSLYYGTYKKTTNNGKFLVLQCVEGSNSLPMVGQSMAFETKFKASSNKTIRMAILKNVGQIDSLPSGTSDFTSIVTSWNGDTTDPTFASNLAIIGSPQSCAVTTGWQKFSISQSIPSGTKNVLVAFWSDSAFSLNDTLSVGESGLYPSGPPLVWNPDIKSSLLEKAQRYFEKNLDIDAGITAVSAGYAQIFCGAAAANAVGQVMYPYKVTKRILPVVTIYPIDGSPAGSAWWYSYVSGAGAEGVVSTNQPTTNYYSFGVAATGRTIGESILVSFYITSDAEIY